VEKVARFVATVLAHAAGWLIGFGLAKLILGR
jgi:hypothetical protein